MPALDRLRNLIAAENPYTNGGVDDMDIYLLAQSGNPGLSPGGWREARSMSRWPSIPGPGISKECRNR